MRDLEREIAEMENKVFTDLINNIKAMCAEACSPAHIAEMQEKARESEEIRKLQEETKRLKVIESVFNGTIQYSKEGK